MYEREREREENNEDKKNIKGPYILSFVYLNKIQFIKLNPN